MHNAVVLFISLEVAVLAVILVYGLLVHRGTP